MDKRLLKRIVDMLEDVFTENVALRHLLQPPHGSTSNEQVDAMLARAKDNPEVRERVAQLLKPLRRRIEATANLEGALKEFVEKLPLKRDVNEDRSQRPF